ncbi:hypothetical protein BJV77DRAFT_741866 [Russula vinacea]|nr:hypothetical protein BJV77DRAFT_741866 [Russula vinacea]
MQGAYIMPFLLHKLDEPNLEITDPGCTLDMLSSWTCINFETLCVNSPTNAIYMTNHEHTLFRCFRFYLDKEVYPNNPNKYKVHMVRESHI